MTMTRQDFTFLAETLKEEYDEAWSDYRTLCLGSSDEVKAYAYSRYEPVALSLGRTARRIADHAALSNPLFREWTFFEACGMQKFYCLKNVERAKACIADGDNDDDKYALWAYIATDKYIHKAGA